MQFAAASNHRLLGPITELITDPLWDWTRDFPLISQRAQNLVCNDAFAAAMCAAKLATTHGPRGLVARSLAYTKNDGQTTDAERGLRRFIDTRLDQARDTSFDAAGLLTRKEFELSLDWLATVLGEGFAIRCWNPGRPGAKFATCWRLVRPERVCNPDGQPNSDTLYNGFVLDADGHIQGIHILLGRMGPFGQLFDKRWKYVPWFDDQGTRNVIHKTGWRLPGMIRGVSMFAPMLLLTKQLAGTIEAYVAAKRGQACTAIIYYVDDPEEAAKEARADSNSILGPHTKFNPFQVYYAKMGRTVEFKNVAFNGQDLDAFFNLNYRVLTAVWQMPVEVALAQMGKASLSSARAGLDQLDRTGQGWQEDQIQQADKPIDNAYIRELELRGEITEGEAGFAGLEQNAYSRPPKYSTDRKKDAETVALEIAIGRSKSAAFADRGWNFTDETEERVQDDVFERDAREEAELPPLPDSSSQAAVATEPEPAPADDDADDDEAPKKTDDDTTAATAASTQDAA